MTPYYLSRHVYPCLTADGMVLLDLKNDRYLGLDFAEMRALHGQVAEWPTVPSTVLPGTPDVSPSAAVERLRARGVLTDDGSMGKPASVVKLETATITLTDEDIGDHVQFTTRHVLALATACSVARIMMKCASLERVIHRAAQRKLTRRRHSVEIRHAVDLARVFRYLRPMFFTAKMQCLLDSFALVEFLSRFDVYPDWALGVRTAPFGAHSWVQYEHVVLNSSLTQAREFTPILVV